MANRWGKKWELADFIFLCLKITADDDCSHEIKRHLLLGRKAMTNLDSILRSRGITLLTEVHIVKAVVFSICTFMYRCESWTVRKAECRRNDAFKLWSWRRPESPLDSKEIKPVSPKGNQPWIFIGRTDAEAETPILWPPNEKSGLDGKDPAAGKDWGQKEKEMTEDEMVGWHHQLSWHEFEQTLGDSEWQGSLTCYSSWRHKELDKTYWLNNYQAHTQLITSSALNSPLIYNWLILSSLDPSVLCLGMSLFAFILRDT